jgi:hypothetical protein
MTALLTHDQIDVLKPGPELDALVAEQVMGWKHFPKPFGYPGTWERPDGSTEYGLLPPHYSTDIKSAWEIVEKMLSTGDQTLYLAFVRYLADGLVAPEHIACLRLCRAALHTTLEISL